MRTLANIIQEGLAKRRERRRRRGPRAYRLDGDGWPPDDPEGPTAGITPQQFRADCRERRSASNL